MMVFITLDPFITKYLQRLNFCHISSAHRYNTDTMKILGTTKSKIVLPF